MKQIYLFVLLIFSLSCSQQQPKLKKYVVQIDTKQLDIFGTGLEDVTKIDSIEVLNDSAAYVEGANSFIARIRTHDLLKSNGVEISTKPKAFRVINESGDNLEELLPIEFTDKVKVYATSNGAIHDKIIDSIWSSTIELNNKLKAKK